QLKKNFGKESMGIVRTTFIIDEDGVIIDVIEKGKVKSQMDELKAILGCLEMKAVSLQRMGGVENDLVEAFQNVKFIFTQGGSDINDHIKKDLNILFGYDVKLDEDFWK